MLMIPELGRKMTEELEFEVILGYVVSSKPFLDYLDIKPI